MKWCNREACSLDFGESFNLTARRWCWWIYGIFELIFVVSGALSFLISRTFAMIHFWFFIRLCWLVQSQRRCSLKLRFFKLFICDGFCVHEARIKTLWYTHSRNVAITSQGVRMNSSQTSLSMRAIDTPKRRRSFNNFLILISVRYFPPFSTDHRNRLFGVAFEVIGVVTRTERHIDFGNIPRIHSDSHRPFCRYRQFKNFQFFPFSTFVRSSDDLVETMRRYQSALLSVECCVWLCEFMWIYAHSSWCAYPPSLYSM